jgi:hypothetical protein
MSDQIEELIREIAAKHGIAVARDDPILVLQTINNRLLQDSAAAQQAQLDQFREELEAISMRWRIDAKAKAERVVNAALAASKTTMEQMMLDGARTTSELLRSELNSTLISIISHARESRHAAMLNLLASCFTILAVVLAVWHFSS